MKFESLEDAERAYKDLLGGCTIMFNQVKAYQVAIYALIATHPNHQDFQLHLSKLSHMIDTGKIDMMLDEQDKEYFEKYLSPMMQLHPVQMPIDPFFGQKIFPDSK